MPDIGAPELIIVAIIVLLLFGPGKAADLGGSLGKSIREFRKATREEGGATSATSLPSAASSTDAQASPSTAPTGSRYCIECGVKATQSQRFCINCGKPLAA